MDVHGVAKGQGQHDDVLIEQALVHVLEAQALGTAAIEREENGLCGGAGDGGLLGL